MPSIQCRKHQNADNFSGFNTSNYVRRDLILVNEGSVFKKETSTHNLERMFHRFTKIT